MKKYNCLLEKISNELTIDKGIKENEINYKLRIIYSVLGKFGIASLYDKIDDENISIINFKTRIKKEMYSLLDMYSEVGNDLAMEKDNEIYIINEIYNIYKKAGYFYHTERRIAPPLPKNVQLGRCQFKRGYSFNEIQSMSGLGFYNYLENSVGKESLLRFYSIEKDRLETCWINTIKQAEWKQFELSEDIEFLNMNFEQNYSYWKNKPEKDSTISILRTKTEGGKLYFLYKNENNNMYISQLASWKVQNGEYMYLANACLKYNNMLPKIRYNYDGKIVNISLRYLLAPSEQNLLMLYSWPADFLKIESFFEYNFNRIFNKDVFLELKSEYESLGYEFEERE